SAHVGAMADHRAGPDPRRTFHKGTGPDTGGAVKVNVAFDHGVGMNPSLAIVCDCCNECVEPVQQFPWHPGGQEVLQELRQAITGPQLSCTDHESIVSAAAMRIVALQPVEV